MQPLVPRICCLFEKGELQYSFRRQPWLHIDRLDQLELQVRMGDEWHQPKNIWSVIVPQIISVVNYLQCKKVEIGSFMHNFYTQSKKKIPCVPILLIQMININENF